MRLEIIAVYSLPLIRTHFMISPDRRALRANVPDLHAKGGYKSICKGNRVSPKKPLAISTAKIGGLYDQSTRINRQKHVRIGHSSYEPPLHRIGDCLYRTSKLSQSDTRTASAIQRTNKKNMLTRH